MPRSLIPVDVVIPVYRGEAETRACVDSVLAARTRQRCEIVVIDDASPEPALSAWLRSLAASGRITLIVHDANRGFVATANEGFALHPDRDVVLLNSDTEVADGWLDRLVGHAAGDPAIGTATPFSTNATICSYPRTLAGNVLPRGETTASLDAACAAANPGLCIDIPTAVGFCMHVTRRCLDEVGVFDEARYGAGYGEEVDFCMRAARAGFRNVLAADLFVTHVGEVSFGNSGLERRAKAQATVDALYPEFQPRLRDYLDRDPACVARRRVDLERMRRARAPRELFVAPLAPEVKTRMEALAASGECEVLLLQPWRDAFVELTWVGRDEEFRLWFHRDEEAAQLTALLGAIGVSQAHVHGKDAPADFPASTAPDVAALRWRAPAETVSASAAPPETLSAPPAPPAPGAPASPARSPGFFARLMRRLR
jgi:GT2 family glycosyltransferase